jgi:signal transduction histidine kinase
VTEGEVDVLRRELAESRREVAALQLARSNRNDFLTRVAHDLRSPLTIISINAGVLLRMIPAADSGKAARKLVQRIQGSSDLMNHCVGDLLDVAGAESGRVSCEPSPWAAAALLEQARETVVALADDAGLTLDLDVQVPPEAMVLCDRSRFLQLVSHVVASATKLVSRGGHLTIGVEGQDSHLRFWVKDAGRAADGSDPGLVVARSLVEAQGGTLSVESGAGNTVAFTLPRAPESVTSG